MKPTSNPGQFRVPTNWARRRPIPGALRLESEGSGVNVLGWNEGGVAGLVAVAFSNEVGTITTLSKCCSKLAMLTGNGQRTLAVR